jgi:hypothetical protein
LWNARHAMVRVRRVAVCATRHRIPPSPTLTRRAGIVVGVRFRSLLAGSCKVRKMATLRSVHHRSCACRHAPTVVVGSPVCGHMDSG